MSSIMIVTSEGRYFFKPEEIIRLEASSNYTFIYFINNKKMLTCRLLKDYEILLQGLGFVRTHRSHLVNKRHVRHVDERGNILMQDSSRAEISRRKKNVVMRALVAA